MKDFRISISKLLKMKQNLLFDPKLLIHPIAIIQKHLNFHGFNLFSNPFTIYHLLNE